MRCPKCRYISFDENVRCRNCGYDFSLIQTDAPIDLPIRTEEAIGPMADLRLKVAQRRQAAAAALTPPSAGEGLSLHQPADLPLFNGATEPDAPDDKPLVSGNAPPRPPLAVRRAAPVAPAPTPVQRSRLEDRVQEEQALDFAEWADVVRPLGNVPASHAGSQRIEDVPRAIGVVDTETTASAGARLVGAAVDAFVTVAIDAGVLYFTLRLCGLQPAEIRVLPVVPMVAFLLLLNGGYFTMFTAAGGQTIGKMLAGTRVVAAAPAAWPQRLPFGTAVIRTVACLVSVLPAGAGFFMALFRADGRALHDAVADTRVIKA